eukprot:TRINITY_DN24763_c0_g1_i1.p1 TRINITY_DN24763_c0_g1~~TRINITY_DN24763_c0_g1_i1.p1  ORF type:complete len:522 (+),score=169.23 TRINITY_DN24763_c0_g1_i1:50-1567(+)
MGRRRRRRPGSPASPATATDGSPDGSPAAAAAARTPPSVPPLDFVTAQEWSIDPTASPPVWALTPDCPSSARTDDGDDDDALRRWVAEMAGDDPDTAPLTPEAISGAFTALHAGEADGTAESIRDKLLTLHPRVDPAALCASGEAALARCLLVTVMAAPNSVSVGRSLSVRLARMLVRTVEDLGIDVDSGSPLALSSARSSRATPQAMAKQALRSEHHYEVALAEATQEKETLSSHCASLAEEVDFLRRRLAETEQHFHGLLDRRLSHTGTELTDCTERTNAEAATLDVAAHEAEVVKLRSMLRDRDVTESVMHTELAEARSAIQRLQEEVTVQGSCVRSAEKVRRELEAATEANAELIDELATLRDEHAATQARARELSGSVRQVRDAEKSARAAQEDAVECLAEERARAAVLEAELVETRERLAQTAPTPPWDPPPGAAVESPVRVTHSFAEELALAGHGTPAPGTAACLDIDDVCADAADARAEAVRLAAAARLLLRRAAAA